MHIQKKIYPLRSDTAWDFADDNISMALMKRLKARIARRESRLKNLPLEVSSKETGPELLPAA